MDPFLWGAGLEAAGAALGGWISSRGQADTNAKSLAEARENMAFQERMSGTAYQRSVADMRKAGINPMLAYAQGGASAPSGSTMPLQNPMSGIGSGISSAAGAYRRNLELRNMMSTNRQIESQTRLNNATAKAQSKLGGLYVSNARQADAQTGSIVAGTPTKQVESGFMQDMRNTYTSAKSGARQFGKYLGGKVFYFTHPFQMGGYLSNKSKVRLK